MSLKSDFIHFFNDLIHLYIDCRGSGAYSPQGTKFWCHWCQQKRLVTSVICCWFQIIDDNSFWTSSPKGNDRSSVSIVPRSICPKTLCSLSPAPMMLHIKFDQDWPTGFRDIQVQKCEIFVTPGQVTPKWVIWFGPKSNSTELLCLSWLSATLMMIKTKMNKLVWRHLFPL